MNDFLSILYSDLIVVNISFENNIAITKAFKNSKDAYLFIDKYKKFNNISIVCGLSSKE